MNPIAKQIPDISAIVVRIERATICSIFASIVGSRDFVLQTT
jgi:hypothetical protein